ncbi:MULTISPECIES: ribosomal-processing cysteine protease Prp [Paenibacillus]|uniref:Ribosomal processing cysteine protease Prp n=1 Tax=Paenibacillus xylanilyticus TaxID=248903 RepID=A0A7Y6ES12_9BACL|nr:ribosomal-processing cysteine protease Prp [Paenibacillus xylanilyticus]NUU74467.1 ribosomal-processing cysteine protease Prp [Paenibacillus xylanilyticus]
MIIVQIFRNDDESIDRFSIEGHANYAKRGEDIVCAGVSAVTVGTVNSIETLTGVEMDAKMKNGFLSASLPMLERDETWSQVQLLLESMVLMLTDIAESYGKYIKIEQLK